MPRTVPLFRSAWGVLKSEWHGGKFTSLDEFFAATKALQYTGVEMPVVTCLQYEEEHGEGSLREVLDRHGLQLICTAFSSGFMAPGTHFDSCLAPSDSDIDTHVRVLCEQYRLARHRFGAYRINTHSGMPGWTLDTCRHFYDTVHNELVRMSMDVDVVHETHRGRALFSPWTTLQLVRDLGDALNLNADLSHWVVVSEAFPVTQDGDFAFVYPELSSIVQKIGYFILAHRICFRCCTSCTYDMNSKQCKARARTLQ
ncbi:MAG: hypothetical protein MHM6MM_005502 [Cercozoa sp. M6MM]